MQVIQSKEIHYGMPLRKHLMDIFLLINNASPTTTSYKKGHGVKAET